MIASTISASVRPFDTIAMRTATKPANSAPTIGTKAETKVSTASGSTRGTPRIHRPRPMKTASSRPTSAWERTNTPSVSQPRAATTGMSVASRPGSWRVSHGRNRGPSLRKKNIRKSARTAVTRPLTTVFTAVTTVVTMLPALSCRREIAASDACVIWSSPMFSGGPAAQSRTLWMPSITPSVSSPDWDATGTAISATTPVATSRNTTVTAEAAAAGGHPWRRRKRVGGQVSVVRRRPMTRGQTTDHMRPRSHSVTVAIPRISSRSSETRADARSAVRVFAELNVGGMDHPYHIPAASSRLPGNSLESHTC